MRYKYFLVLLIFTTLLPSFTFSEKNILIFRTSTRHIIKVVKGQIFFDKKRIFKIDFAGDILYKSKSNQLIEDHGSIFLFIAMYGRPNKDRINAFFIEPTKATLVADAILSQIKDYDGDGYLEFGGRDLTEIYPNSDSMYYIPNDYYEIRKGKIHPDKLLTKNEDIKINGLYLPRNKQQDSDGNCCKVVPIPGRKHKAHIQTKSFLIVKSFMGSDTITVRATKFVLDGIDDITNVDHFKDGSWLFYSSNRTYTTETAAKKVKLATIIKLDKTILLLSWMPKGYLSTRTSKNEPWVLTKLKEKD